MVDRRETGLELREDFREDLSQGQEEETGWLPRTSDSQCGFVVPGDQTHPCSPLSLPAAVLWREAIALFQACNTGKSLFPPGSESPRDLDQKAQETKHSYKMEPQNAADTIITT